MSIAIVKGWINRTSVELKLSHLAILSLPYSRINRTSVELKLLIAGLALHAVGRINRTSVELKRVSLLLDHSWHPGLIVPVWN